MSNLDELFKEKLTGHSVTPPASAWDKVEANLSKKNSAIIWWRWAAVFLIGGLLLSTPWLLKDEVQQPISKKKEPVPQKNESATEKISSPTLAEGSTTSKVEISRTVRRKRTKSLPNNIVKPTPVEETIASNKIQEEKLNPEATVAVAPASSKSIVLTYTLEDVTTAVETPTEVKEEVVAVVEAPKKEKSFKKVMTFAKEMKNGDRPLSLRDMKDELFAGDLKKKTTDKKH